MRVLFVIKHPGAMRNLGSTVEALAARGHAVHLAFDAVKTAESEALVKRFAAGQPSITVGRTPRLERTRRTALSDALRRSIDYLRYLEPRHAGTPSLTARARAAAPTVTRVAAGLPLFRPTRVRQVLQGLERRIPPPRELERFVREQAPDLVLVAPLVGIGSRQADVVRAARRLGIRTGLPVLSWDNLTNKGLLRDVPDVVVVWNELQAQEAVQLHGVPRDRVVVSGAAAYDHWFAWRPERTREGLARESGAPPEGPLLLYVCSSPFIAPDEVPVVRRWLAALRSADGELAEAAVIVRPHPQNAGQWGDVRLEDDRAVVWPPAGEDPASADARGRYYDSIHHSAAVVGLNTSALVEAAIVGRPVLTFVTPETRATQEGTLHFRYLVDAKTGHLVVGSSLEQHVEQLREALRDPDAGLQRSARFLRSFVRPLGLGVPATPFAVDALEGGGKPPRLRRGRPDAVDDADRVLRVLAEQTDGPILVGPWLAEVGFELLYWIPFLQRAVDVHSGLAERLVPVTRGGAGAWYGNVATETRELYDLVEPHELALLLERSRVENDGYRKQYAETALDRRLLDEVRARDRRLAAAPVLHPSTMFAAYRALAKENTLLERAGELFRHRRLPTGDRLDGLPADYVAVRFYSSPAFPHTPETAATVERVVAELAAQLDVVVLGPGRRLDDHEDLEPAGANVHRLPEIPPSRNLAVQSAAIAGARALVGTYGGLSYLGPLLGVPTTGVHADAGRFRQRHLDLAGQVFAADGFGAFEVVDVPSLAGIPATRLGRLERTST